MCDITTATLENWIESPSGPNTCFINGRILNDAKERFDDDTYVNTSKIKGSGFQEGDIVTTTNSTYRLGKKSGSDSIPTALR